jgi:hypothetical protein
MVYTLELSRNFQDGVVYSEQIPHDALLVVTPVCKECEAVAAVNQVPAG